METKQKEVTMVEVKTQNGGFFGRYRDLKRAQKVRKWLEERGVKAYLVLK